MEGPGRRWLVCLGHVPATEQSCAAGRDRTDRDRQQGPVRPSPHAAPATCTPGCRRRRPISRDEFLEATTDLWEIPPESATRVGHPAPSPIELPKRLIELYTYEGDVVLDPFMGSGTTAVAALRTNRHYIGFDTDVAYVSRARTRIAVEKQRLEHPTDIATAFRVQLSADRSIADRNGSTGARRT